MRACAGEEGECPRNVNVKGGPRNVNVKGGREGEAEEEGACLRRGHHPMMGLGLLEEIGGAVPRASCVFSCGSLGSPRLAYDDPQPLPRRVDLLIQE